jgi:hypothetical protein
MSVDATSANKLATIDLFMAASSFRPARAGDRSARVYRIGSVPPLTTADRERMLGPAPVGAVEVR